MAGLRLARAFSSNAWLIKKIEEVQKSNPEKTISIVAHQSEVKDGQLDGVLPKGLSQCKDFRQDLNMGGAYWFYNSKRMLLLQKSKDKEDAKEADIRQSYRKLGTTACAALQQKKTADVEFLVTSKVAESNMLGIFENSFYLSNYENSHKSSPPSEEAADGEKKPEEEDKDERTKRV